MNQQALPGASTVLIMGIISIVGSIFCCGPFAVVFSIIGLVKAKSAEKLFHDNPELYSDYSNVKTGKILCYIGLGLSLIMLILGIIYFGVIFAMIASGDFNNL